MISGASDEELEIAIDRADLLLKIQKLQQENQQLKENYNAILKQRDDISKNATEQIESLINDKRERDLYKSVIDEIKWKSIEEYNRKEYDWVLVKYFDDNYECVPNVAEMGIDGKWYTHSNEQIMFEIKYFMDMQTLDKIEEILDKANIKESE